MGVLVLNASMEPLHTVSVPHAVRMVVRRVAEAGTQLLVTPHVPSWAELNA